MSCGAIGRDLQALGVTFSVSDIIKLDLMTSMPLPTLIIVVIITAGNIFEHLLYARHRAWIVAFNLYFNPISRRYQTHFADV